MAGEKDGLARVFRMAEASYRLNKKNADESSADKFPVVLLNGVSHMQFSSGEPPLNVKKNDLRPEVTLEDAH